MQLAKYSQLKDFLHCLTSDDITHRQKKAILLNANKIQRLGLIEITLNVTYGNIELGEERLTALRKYRLGLRRICSRGSSGNNQLLASNLSALILVLKIALDHTIPTRSDNKVAAEGQQVGAVHEAELKSLDTDKVETPSGVDLAEIKD